MLTPRGKVSLFAGLLAALFVVSIISTNADVDSRWDWPGKKRTLKICVVSTTGCPAGFADSVQGAIDTWNADLTSWTLTYTTDCSTADVKISCANISGLGEWSADYNSSTKEATNHKIKIKSGADWGYCDDKYEVKSTLIHELGHAMRLNHTHSTDQMRAGQGKTGHLNDISTKDSTEAALSDGSESSSTTTDPPGAQRQVPYSGTITPGPGDPPLDLFNTTNIDLQFYRPTMVQVQSINPLDPETLQFDAIIDPNADGTEPFVLVIERPGPVIEERWGFLHVVDLTYNVGWEPVAVAPPDTSVAGPSSPINLYTTLSTHGGGFDQMDFTWIVNGNAMIKGENSTTITLPIGTHQIELLAKDQFGKESVDNMIVTVGGGGIPVMGPEGIVILISLLLLLSIFFMRRRTAHGMLASLLRVVNGR